MQKYLSRKYGAIKIDRKSRSFFFCVPENGLLLFCGDRKPPLFFVYLGRHLALRGEKSESRYEQSEAT